MKNKINDIYTIDIEAKVEFSQDLKDSYTFLQYTDENIRDQYAETQQKYCFIRQLVYLASKNVSWADIFPYAIKHEDQQGSLDMKALYDFFVVLCECNDQLNSFLNFRYQRNGTVEFENRSIRMYQDTFKSLFDADIKEKKDIEKIPFLQCKEFKFWLEEIKKLIGTRDIPKTADDHFAQKIHEMHMDALGNGYASEIVFNDDYCRIYDSTILPIGKDYIKIQFSETLLKWYPFLKNKDRKQEKPGEEQQLYWFIHQLVYLALNNISLNVFLPHKEMKNCLCDDLKNQDLAIKQLHIRNAFINFFIQLYGFNIRTKCVLYEKYSLHNKDESLYLKYTSGKNMVTKLDFLNIFNKLSHKDNSIPDYAASFPFIMADEFQQWRLEIEEWLGLDIETKKIARMRLNAKIKYFVVSTLFLCIAYKISRKMRTKNCKHSAVRYE